MKTEKDKSVSKIQAIVLFTFVRNKFIMIKRNDLSLRIKSTVYINIDPLKTSSDL